MTLHLVAPNIVTELMPRSHYHRHHQLHSLQWYPCSLRAPATVLIVVRPPLILLTTVRVVQLSYVVIVAVVMASCVLDTTWENSVIFKINL